MIDFSQFVSLYKMEQNFKMLEKWGDKVRIIYIIIGEPSEEDVKLFDEIGWTKVELYLKASSKCSDDYAIRTDPEVALVDTNGQVAFIGDPESVELEKSIESLISGGDVIKRVKSGAGDPANTKEEILKFSTEVCEKINEVLLKYCKLERSIVDALILSTYDIHTNKMIKAYNEINIRLIGPNAEIVPARAEIEKILAEFTLAEFTFETHWAVRPSD